MDEEEFDALMKSQPFGTKDAMQPDARLRLCSTLGIALWGRSHEDLQRQPLVPYPQIRSGFALADFQEL
jgi:hypothetical protein